MAPVRTGTHGPTGQGHRGTVLIKKLFNISIALSLVIAFLPIAPETQAEAVETATETIQLEDGTYDESKVIVKFKDSVESDTATSVLESTDSVKNKFEGEVEEIADNVATVKVEDGRSVSDAISELENDPRVEYAEPNYYGQLFDEDASLSKTYVTDPYVNDQLHITDSYAKVQEAWDVVKGQNSNVTVAIIDSGIDTDHPDLVGNIVAKASMTSTGYEDQLGHGTSVAGIVSARTNNGVGVAGVSYNARILPIKITDVSSGFDTSTVSNALQWVVDNAAKYNIKVVNMSLGIGYTQTVEELIDKLFEKGIICVCASGNGYSTSGVSFPASLSNTIAVGAVDANHKRVSYSNGGSNLDVVALGSYSNTYPTSGVFTTLIYGGYGDAGHGTSFAAPFVAATAALCYAAKSNATAAAVKEAITSTAKDLGDTGKDNYYGYGQVVVKDAVNKIKQPAAGDRVLTNGNTYFINSAVTGKPMEIGGGSFVNGAGVNQYTLNNTFAQQWKVTYDSDNYATFTNVNSGKVLDVSGGSAHSGARVQQYQSNGTDAQKWKVEKSGDQLIIRSKINNNYVLDLSGASSADGAQIWLYASNNSQAQRWGFYDITGKSAEVASKASNNSSVVSAGTYLISTNVASNRSLDVAGGSASSGANVQSYQTNRSNAQKWKVDFVNNYARITNVGSGKVLDISGAGTSPGTNVQQYAWNGSMAQKWVFIKNSNNSIKIQSALFPNLVLDIAGGSGAICANVQVYTDNGSAAQQWKFISV